MEQPLGIAQEAMNKQGNKNAANFTCAMDFEASFKTESNAVNNENGVLFVANGKKVKMLHLYSPKNCGGTVYALQEGGHQELRGRPLDELNILPLSPLPIPEGEVGGILW